MDLTLNCLAITCSLKPSPDASSSEKIAEQILDELRALGATGESVRAVDFAIAPGVETDMGDGDQWPEIREKVLAADILILATPTWLGQHSSVAQRVLERLDAELSETDGSGRPILFDKVALAAIVGNEDGAHHIAAILFQSLNDVGFTVPAQGSVYWNGEAMQGVDYQDLPQTPEKVAQAMKTAAANAAHLARSLKISHYPA
ncbi:flavodoxin [Microbacterium nanhaiense]|uniref:Flavodoxin n=1 Tax=Microbacterium nanhaiense TaxID=1301026 RepID=A0ABQ2MX12_9MICO|nr:NAD(P)H-dependent oxidoreductase [Microbacterium nanhaiense]GGO60462.1 flavodoxin [Microbacterium nanhaiense]